MCSIYFKIISNIFGDYSFKFFKIFKIIINNYSFRVKVKIIIDIMT